MPRAFARVAGQALLCLMLMGPASFIACAQSSTMAWLDRDRITLDDTALLTIESDGLHDIPDLDFLARDFVVLEQWQEHRIGLGPRGPEPRAILRLVLRPRRAGVVDIPALRIGRDITLPSRLIVLPGQGPASGGSPMPDDTPDGDEAQERMVVVESRVDTLAPYVQQTVGYTVRWSYESASLVDGEILQDPPDGASLRRLGEDIQRTVRHDGRFIKVFERRYLLIPERAGTIAVPPARFHGRGLGAFDSVFDPVRHEIRVGSAPIALQVKPVPAGAPQPWLPLRALDLRYLDTPRSLRAGESATITVELSAEGAMATQLPALTLDAGTTAQVFPDLARRDERFVDGRVQATVTRRFAILPTREGVLRIAGARQTWWDANAGVMRIASLPDLVLKVGPGRSGAARERASGATDGRRASVPGGWPDGVPRGGWLVAALVLVLAWVGVVAWAWRLLSGHRGAKAANAGPGLSGPPVPSLAQVLAQGDLAAIAGHLCAMAGPPSVDLDGLRARLSDPAQRAAVLALQRARWGDGARPDAHAATLATLRTAFAQGPRWCVAQVDTGDAGLLPPLYPA